MGDELLEAVQRALARRAAERQTQLIKKREWRARYERLTPREREVFALVLGAARLAKSLISWRKGWDSNPRYGYPYA